MINNVGCLLDRRKRRRAITAVACCYVLYILDTCEAKMKGIASTSYQQCTYGVLIFSLTPAVMS